MRNLIEVMMMEMALTYYEEDDHDTTSIQKISDDIFKNGNHGWNLWIMGNLLFDIY